MTDVAFEVENVGCVQKLSGIFRPGVNVFKGLNGAGKTICVQAVMRGLGEKQPVEPRDGAAEGRVRVGGALLRVSKSISRKGEVKIALADVSPVSRLIDPQIKDEEARGRARIRALVELLAVEITEERLAHLCGGDEEMSGWFMSEAAHKEENLMEAAEMLRRESHSIARQQEGIRDEATFKLRAADDVCKEILDHLGGEQRLVRETPEAARGQLIEASREYERLRAGCDAREDLEERQERIRATLGERPEPDSKLEEIAEHEAKVKELIRREEVLEAELAKVRSERDDAVDAYSLAQEKRRELQEARALWDERQAILNEEATGATRAEVAEFKVKHLDEAERMTERANLSETYWNRKEDAGGARQRAQQADERATQLRQLADEIPTRLGEILADAGAPGLTVAGGRLAAIRNDGSTVDFDTRLSDGQRVRVAFDIALACKVGAFNLSPTFWQCLDPENKAHMAELAAERKLFVFTEEPAKGELRVEHLGGSVAA
jgi:hypothetical protein